MKRLVLWLALLAVPLSSFAQSKNVCTTLPGIGATGRTQITAGGSTNLSAFNGGNFTYRTTGSPSGVSITIEAGNVALGTQDPFTKVSAVTNTAGADMGSATGVYNYWWVNVGTLSGGTSPKVIVTACMTPITLSAAGGIPGEGTVTNFSTGNLSPIFTASVGNPSTTPALSFSLSNAAAHRFLGNNTGSTAAPSYQQVKDADIGFADITTGNASGSAHGFMPKGTGSATDCYLGNNTIGACPGSGGGMAIGGTVTSGTPGSLLFVGSGPVLAQNNANLFWDATNLGLNIGTTTPAVGLPYLNVSKLYDDSDNNDSSVGINLSTSATNASAKASNVLQGFTVYADMTDADNAEVTGAVIGAYNNSATGGALDTLKALDLGVGNIGSGSTVVDAIALNIHDVSGATNNYAIKTGTGKVEFNGSEALTEGNTPAFPSTSGATKPLCYNDTTPPGTLSNCTVPRALSFSIGDPGGSALSAASTTTAYITVPFACTIAAYNLVIDAGTITVKFWKKATGTAIPTSSDSINTSGVAISSGTAIHSTTVSDFTTTTVAANDIVAMNVSTVATAKFVNGVLQCNQTVF